MGDLHEVELSWPYGDASDVILTGSFDHWSCTMHLPKGASGFVGNVRVPWNEKIPYKFIVDGKWVTRNDRPTEFDAAGNLNNVLIAPSKPIPIIPIMEHPSTTVPQGPTDSMSSATTLPEESLLSSETSPQQALEADQPCGITESDSTNATSAVDDVDVSDKDVVSTQVPDIIVESAEPPASSGENDTFHAIVDTATSAASHVSEDVSSVLEYVSSGISYMFSSTPRASTDNVDVLGTTEQPSTTSAIEPIVAEAPVESAQGSPLPDITEAAPQIAPVVPILILPVNDYMLNESASPDPESDARDLLASDSLDATVLGTHSPILLSKPSLSTTQEVQTREQESKLAEEENSEVQGAEEEKEESLVDTVAPPPDAAATSTTPEIDVNPGPAQTSHASALDAAPIVANNESSLPAPESQDIPEVAGSSMPSTNDVPKDSKEVSFPASATTDPTVISSSKFSTASTKKKRRPLFAKLREYFSRKEKTKK